MCRFTVTTPSLFVKNQYRLIYVLSNLSLIVPRNTSLTFSSILHDSVVYPCVGMAGLRKLYFISWFGCLLSQALNDANFIMLIYHLFQVGTALTICQTLATAMGPNIKQHVRVVSPGIVTCFGDSKVSGHIRYASDRIFHSGHVKLSLNGISCHFGWDSDAL